MKTKIFFVIFVIMFSAGLLNSQSAWVKQFSNVTATLSSVHFIDSLNGWTCGTGILLKTTNGGDNWLPVPGFPPGNHVNMKFFNNNSALIYSNTGILYKTNNAWNSWISIQTGSAFNNVSFADFNNGMGFNSTYLYKTTNGGLNWNNILTSPVIKAISYLDSNTGYVGYQVQDPYNNYFKSFVLKTINGGATWSTVFILDLAPEVYTVCFRNPNTGMISGARTSATHYTFMTFNGGVSWTSPVTDPSMWTSCFALAGSSDIWISGQYIHYSSNSGTNFTINEYFNYPTFFYSIYFVSNLRGWMVGNYGKIYRTTSGPNKVPYPPTLISPANGDTNIYLNARFNWATSVTATSYRIQIASDSLFSNIAIDSGGISSLFFDLPAGKLTHYTSYFWRVNAANNFGSGSWTEIRAFKTSKYACPPTLLIPPYNSNEISLTPVLVWLDFDTTIIHYQVEISLNVNFTNIIFDSSGILPDSISVPPGILNYNTLYFWHVRALNSEGWGPYSIKWIFRTVISGINISSQETPVENKLYQNYPNPFNPATRLKFDISEASDVKLAVYDMLGRKVSEILNGKLNPGTYEAEWNAEANPSGVYFYRLNAGTFTVTKKMLLIK
jgi:photosystem II stability/assembly factor-like uncharacterized protein